MNFEEAIRALRRGDLIIDCVRMTLTKHRQTPPSHFIGKGYIRQDNNDQLVFKLYSDDAGEQNIVAGLQSIFGSQAGRIFDAGDYYELSAIDDTGKTWTASRVLPEFNWPRECSPIITGRPQWISAASAGPSFGGRLRIHFFEKVSVPSIEMSETRTPDDIVHTRDTTRVRVSNCDLTIRRTDDELVARADSDSDIPPHLHLRIQESLEYFLSQSLPWRALLQTTAAGYNLKLASRLKRAAATHLEPPVSYSHAIFDNSWGLFSKYLEYVSGTNDGDAWHECSYHIHNAREASSNTVHARAIGLVVAVEGISRLVPNSPTPEEAVEKRAVTKSLTEHIRSQYPSHASRLCGLVSMLNDDRVTDRLAPLIRTGYVNESYVKSWSNLRNRQVHPRLSDRSRTMSADLQEMVDLIHQVETLMYQITFYLVGYVGRFTDYGVRGWPARQYPLSLTPS